MKTKHFQKQFIPFVNKLSALDTGISRAVTAMINDAVVKALVSNTRNASGGPNTTKLKLNSMV
jgi:hypothetical protein